MILTLNKDFIDSNLTELFKENCILKGFFGSKEEKQDDFIQRYIDLLNDTDVIVGGSNIPKNSSDNFSRILIEIANAQGKSFILDAKEEQLKQGIKAKPYCTKLNIEEIEKLTGRKIQKQQDIIDELIKLRDMGINFTVTLVGSQEIIAGYEDKFFIVDSSEIEGCEEITISEAFLTGIAFGFKKSYAIEDALKFATVCEIVSKMGSSFEEDKAENLLWKIRVIEIQ